MKKHFAAFFMTGFWLGLAGVVLTATQASAQSRHPDIPGYSDEFRANCAAEIQAEIDAYSPETKASHPNLVPNIQNGTTYYPDYLDRPSLEADLAQAEQKIANNEGGSGSEIADRPLIVCSRKILLSHLSKPAPTRQGPAVTAANSNSLSIRGSSGNSGTGGRSGNRGAGGGGNQIALNAPSQESKASAGKNAAPAPGGNKPAQQDANPPKPPGVPAHNCLTLLTGKDAELYGGFQNNCAFKVFVTYCAYRPQKGAWNEIFDCEQQKGGFDWVEGGNALAAHTNGTMMYWFACKDPSWPADTHFVSGRGIVGRCN